ncbi:MAG: hypothetical protein HYZ13_14300 [Acidobacteria bacterium]|nr:hypothetical protein [Acidobacteriota bacterium]
MKLTPPYLLSLVLAPALLAQGGPMPPPPLLWIVREEVKPGHGSAHDKTEAAWTQALIKGKSTDHYLGMMAMTGPGEAWFLFGYRTFADWEAKQGEMEKNPALKAEVDRISAQDGEHISTARSFLAAHRKDLSYGPDVEIGKMRFMRIRIFRIKQGQIGVFEEAVKVAKSAYEKSQVNLPFAFYEVQAGMGQPTFLSIRPMKSLADMDTLGMSDKAMNDALGEEGRKAMQKASIEAFGFVENQIFAFNPKLSFPPPFVVASDPAFWAPKPPSRGAAKPAN